MARPSRGGPSPRRESLKEGHKMKNRPGALRQHEMQVGDYNATIWFRVEKVDSVDADLIARKNAVKMALSDSLAALGLKIVEA